MTQPHLTFIATLSDGTVTTRSSKTRSYSHVVEGTSSHTGTKHALSWHTTEALARKGAATWPSDRWTDIKLAPVTSHPYSSPEAKAARAAEKNTGA